MEFAIPEDGKIYINMIIERCERLIDSGIWEGIDRLRLYTWLNNFDTETEKYFAACILDALIYRSDDQTIALMTQLFQQTIDNLKNSDKPPSGTPDDWFTALQSEDIDPHIRIIPVIRRNDPPTKSGPLLARYYRRHLHINQKWMIWPWNFKEELERNKIFLFIDDFLGTGDQFIEFVDSFKIRMFLSGTYSIYAPLVAHQTGLDHVKSEIKELRLCPVEILDKKHNLFSDESNWFRDHTGNNTPMKARMFFEDLIKKKKLPLRSDEYGGYGNLSIAYCFNHATPDNCLPILWFKNNNWYPLFER